MLLESIKLRNFRQFQDAYIDFASGEDGKNVTIIIGENGTGKTTFAQAFFWCMYGETEFSDKVILSKKVATALLPGRTATVSVELKLMHGQVSYTLTREQTYKRENSGKLTSQNAVFDIAKKDTTGNTVYVKKSLCEAEVQNILPKELSRYFFFDGERIERMSKDITSDKKSSDFAEAVKGLLGLNAMISALGHFNPRSKTSVIGSYESSYDAKSNSKIEEYTRQIDRCNREIENIDLQIEQLDAQIKSAENRRAEKTEEIKQYAEGEKLQKKREALNRQIADIVKSRGAVYKNICREFNANMNSFFSAYMMQGALRLLAEHDFMGKDIPYMHGETIDYLLNRGECICGTCLQEGTIAYRKVKDLADYLPPQSISSSIRDFRKEALTRAKELQDLPEQIQESLAILSQQDDEIYDKQDELRAIEKKLSGEDVRGKVRSLNSEIQICEDTIRRSTAERNKLYSKRGALENDRDRSMTERRNLTLLDDKNRKIEIYKAYAERIYQELNKEYKYSEALVRDQLEKTINDIFKKIYAGGMSLSIDEKYHISVYVNDYDGDVETSTAQSISVIFAFITAIIKMAKENRNSTDEHAQLLTSEPYPLVMDAPLSAFDKRRIKAVCEALPSTAEQVIIFIKDTDGELAESYLGDRIGSRHSFEKKDEFETILI